MKPPLELFHAASGLRELSHVGCDFPQPPSGLQNWTHSLAKLHHKGSHKAAPADSEILLTAISGFLAGCRTPAVVEFGEELLRLIPGEYALEIRSGRLSLEVWSSGRTFSRRILSVDGRASGILECSVHRFGGAPAKLNFLDLDRPQTAHKLQAAERHSFGEQFRRMLFRQFPGWEVSSLSASMDLQRSFSPVFPRARLSKGQTVVAAIACPSADHELELLTFALIWFDHVRAHENPDKRVTLAVFLPENAGAFTAHRLRWLDALKVDIAVYRFNEHGSAGKVDPQDLGNIDTRVASRVIPMHLDGELKQVLRCLAEMENVSYAADLHGAIAIRFRGVEFGQIKNGQFRLGIGNAGRIVEDPLGPALEYMAQLEALSPAAQPGPGQTEAWLETIVRANVQHIDASLQPEPVHSQVLTFAAGDRDVVDLIAVSAGGRLAVLELKASEDIHLPVQALDYWIRVRWHAGAGELQHLFPGTALDSAAPKLLLVAPAISFHSANATILRYFSPEIEVERVGVGSNWKQRLQVVLRLSGGDSPISHGSAYEH